MTNSKNLKFIEVYREFEEEVIFKNNKNKESTIDIKYAISKHIADYLDKYNLEEITYDTIESYKSFRIHQISNKPKNKNKNINSISLCQLDKELITLRKFFNYCLKKDLIDINPVKTKNSFKIVKRGRHSNVTFDTKFKIKKDVLELFQIAVKKYEEKRNKAFPIMDYINNRLNVLLKNKQFFNSGFISCKEDKEQIKIKMYNFITAEIDAYNLDRNKMINWIMEEEIELMSMAYKEGVEKLNLFIQNENKKILEFKKSVSDFMVVFSQLNIFERTLILRKFIKSGIFNFLGYLNEHLFDNKRQEIFYYDNIHGENFGLCDSIEKQIQRKKALHLPFFSYKAFYLKKDIYDKYMMISEIIKNNGDKQDYSLEDLINFKLFELLNKPAIFKKEYLEYEGLLYPYGYLRVNITKSNKDLTANIENKNKLKDVDWHKTMQSIIEHTIILIGEEIDDLDLKKYIPQNIKIPYTQ